ncbi:hypothetical protein INH39_08455 [Massilia violaceinigra]|uniref:Uncharacterized protein n=1 Tax=Massilia violaceinigra TaxID=2045208 RepID=A0ABY4AA71_9BURK|nr:hypothetical protein [Massilia violaceinigra]UOD31699.1 hypothetical protein INH39_08455 [Massilia violaceinigra]
MIRIHNVDNVPLFSDSVSPKDPFTRTWTMAAAKSDLERGLLNCPSIHVHDEQGRFFYTVSLHSTLAIDGVGPLVDARTGGVREFKTMDAAHSAIRQVGFRSARFWGGAQ